MEGNQNNKRTRSDEKDIEERLARLEQAMADRKREEETEACTVRAQHCLKNALSCSKFEKVRADLDENDVFLTISPVTNTCEVRVIDFKFSWNNHHMLARMFPAHPTQMFRVETFAEEKPGLFSNSVAEEFGLMTIWNSEEWRRFADFVHLPDCLLRVERATEFMMAVALEASSPMCARKFESMLTCERDGVHVYAGHGGLMTAAFAPPSGYGKMMLATQN